MLLAPLSSGPSEGRVVESSELSPAELVLAAAGGSRTAWDELVRRFTPLVLSITARYRLSYADAADVSQTVWLQLVQHLPDLREPRALPGWITTTVKHECLRVLRARQRVTALDPQQDGRLQEGPRDRAWPESDEELLRQERHVALLAGFAELSPRQRELLVLLMTDPPPSYSEISDRLGIPVGAIGPTRARALERLRRSPALAALLCSDLIES